MLQNQLYRLLYSTRKTHEAAESAFFTLKRNTRHHLKGARFSILTALDKQLFKISSGNTRGHGTIRQGEYLVLCLPLLVLALLFFKLCFPLLVSPFLSIPLIFISADVIMIFLGIISPKKCSWHGISDR